MMTHKTKLFIFATLMGVTSLASAKSSYELLTETLQYQTARTLGAIAKALLSSPAKQVLLNDVATQTAHEVAIAPTSDAQALVPVEPQDVQLDEQDREKLAALLTITQKLNEALAVSQTTANSLNAELDRVLSLEHEATEAVA